MSTFLLLLWKKNERNLKNILWTHAIRTTTLLTPKFWPTPILWTCATHAKISNYTTHAKTLWTHSTHPKISTHVTYAIFLTHAQILQTHTTHAKVWTKRPMPPRTHATHATHASTLPMPLTRFSRLDEKYRLKTTDLFTFTKEILNKKLDFLSFWEANFAGVSKEIFKLHFENIVLVSALFLSCH